MFDIRQHPEAPDLERIRDVTVDPVPLAEIRERREAGEVLLEDNLRDRDDLDVQLDMSDQPGEEVTGDVGTALYRYTQLFGSPQWPDLFAGEDISDRDDEVFKFLLRATVDQDDESYELPDEWLFTLHDWHVRLGASVATWSEDPDEAFEADTKVALTTLHIAHNLGNEAVQCEFKDIWY